MRIHLAILLALQLLPAALLFKIQLYVDQRRVGDRTQVQVSHETSVQCSAHRTNLIDYSYTSSSLYLRIQHITQQADTRDTYDNLVSFPVSDIGWDLVVTLTGLTDLTTLRCDLSVLSVSSPQATSYTRLVSTYITLSPSSLLTPPPLPSATNALIRLGGGVTSGPTPTDPLAFGSTYMVYTLVIIIFISTLATTGAVACWLSVRVRKNRTQLQRARIARLRELHEVISAAQGDTVVLTNMQMTRREDAPPPYEGAPVSTTISLHIDSAPPCYQEALSQTGDDTQADTSDPPPSFETVSSTLSSLESSVDETEPLISAPPEN